MNNQKQFSNLEKAIIRTLAFFDIFDYPLTLVEIHKWLYQADKACQLAEIFEILETENLKKVIAKKHGFYFLAGREAIIQTRLERYQIAEKKFKIGLKTVRWLRWLVFVKMVAICNNSGYNNATNQSDVDFFIITSAKRLWWTRLGITLITTILGVRRHDQKFIDRVCLSFYISQDHLDLSDIALKPIDPYLIYWFATLVPIYDLGISQRFFASNIWFKDYLPNFYPPTLNHRRRISDNRYINFSKKFDKMILGKKLGDFLEKVAKKLQAKKIKKYFGDSVDQKNTNVVISESMLKFHKTDRRQYYCDVWQKKLNNLGL